MTGNGWPAMTSPIPVPNALAYPRPAMSRRPGWPSRPSGSASRKWKLIAMTSGPARVASTRAACCCSPSRAAVSATAPVSAPSAISR
jgi:hypothetical protein